MADRWSKREQLLKEMIDEDGDMVNTQANICSSNSGITSTPKQQLTELERAKIMELNKWWESVTLKKYIDCKHVPRSLRIVVLPTLSNLDSDPLSQWQTDTTECSMRLINTLVILAERRLAQAMEKIKILEKSLEKFQESA